VEKNRSRPRGESYEEEYDPLPAVPAGRVGARVPTYARIPVSPSAWGMRGGPVQDGQRTHLITSDHISESSWTCDVRLFPSHTLHNLPSLKLLREKKRNSLSPPPHPINLLRKEKKKHDRLVIPPNTLTHRVIGGNLLSVANNLHNHTQPSQQRRENESTRNSW